MRIYIFRKGFIDLMFVPLKISNQPLPRAQKRAEEDPSHASPSSEWLRPRRRSEHGTAVDATERRACKRDAEEGEPPGTWETELG